MPEPKITFNAVVPSYQINPNNIKSAPGALAEGSRLNQSYSAVFNQISFKIDPAAFENMSLDEFMYYTDTLMVQWIKHSDAFIKQHFQISAVGKADANYTKGRAQYFCSEIARKKADTKHEYKEDARLNDRLNCMQATIDSGKKIEKLEQQASVVLNLLRNHESRLQKEFMNLFEKKLKTNPLPPQVLTRIHFHQKNKNVVVQIVAQTRLWTIIRNGNKDYLISKKLIKRIEYYPVIENKKQPVVQDKKIERIRDYHELNQQEYLQFLNDLTKSCGVDKSFPDELVDKCYDHWITLKRNNARELDIYFSLFLFSQKYNYNVNHRASAYEFFGRNCTPEFKAVRERMEQLKPNADLAERQAIEKAFDQMHRCQVEAQSSKK